MLDPRFPTSLDFLVFLVSLILREAPSPQKLLALASSWLKLNDFFSPFWRPGPPCLAMFPIFFVIYAKFPPKNSPKLLSIQKYRVFFDFPCSWTPKIIENHWKTIVLFNDFADFTDFTFSACWHQFWAISQRFWMDLPLKMTVKGLICLPLASLGSIWGQLSASLGNLGSPQSWIVDALPCLGNIFCDLVPPRRLPRQIFH